MEDIDLEELAALEAKATTAPWTAGKVCAVDEIWSGLKLMIRRSER